MAQEVQNGGADNGSARTVTFSSLKPQLFVQAPKAADAVQFYKSAFGAEQVSRTVHPKRKADQELPLILSAELKVGSSFLLVSEQQEDSVASVETENGCVLCLETEDVEGAIANAVNAGAVEVGETTEGESACCGARVGKLKDPFGFVWLICSPVKKSADVDA